MGSQWSRDPAYTRATGEGYRSRASYKLLDIQAKFGIIRPTDSVIDLGSAPGSWLQVLRNITEGVIIGIDLNPIAPLQGVHTITGDFANPLIRAEAQRIIDPVSVVTCDASPKISGKKSYDQARIIDLNEEALRFAQSVLKQGGNFVVKTFQGELFNDLLAEVRAHFYSIRIYRTKATRKGSTETYIIAKNYIHTRDVREAD
ncbi:MAG: Ribosomal RNA large subunit methyltransferase E [Methanomicrobiales archaeon 53_19]|uniref:RlmE family RNA methyltransferase n=1 Tax=Methanocalculus sp. TaxID=2004547 RepID=UPI000748256C|nr:RlmE family RNA methyltransferase [Methanocalculus sp.]KUK70384.1 MAG: Ribosomal RNA large subunit methyltransferase E [Methanocalculus sp. 52_23]KUL04297.1 MAG: Ribosomal RNA large subunit methyltransferase E [Methanomicrobiales archaeon 53_19]HIJ06052.1 RlmE family RNA methyltransferase [Methanocalculus sp.]